VKHLWIFCLLLISISACAPSEEELLKVGLEKMNTQNWADAVAQFDQVLEKNPTQTTALNAKGVALFQQGKIKEAIPLFDQAITNLGLTGAMQTWSSTTTKRPWQTST
jgi:Flp pilus assembly protein TadD